MVIAEANTFVVQTIEMPIQILQTGRSMVHQKISKDVNPWKKYDGRSQFNG